MKKFLSVLLSLLMVVSVVSLAGCKKNVEEPKTNAELFVEAYKQLLIPKLADDLVDLDTVKSANHVAFDIDELSFNVPAEMMGDEEIPTLPNLGFEIFKTGDKSFIVNGDITLDDEILGGTVEIVDGDKFYVSMPEATDLYLAGTVSELFEELIAAGEIEEEDLDAVKTSVGVMLEAFGDYEEIFLNDDNLTSETVEVDVFEETLSLNKLTLKLDTDDIFAFAKRVFEALPEDVKADLEDEEGKTFDELLEDAEKEFGEELDLDIELSFYLDGEDVRSYELECVMEAEEVKVKMMSSADILNTSDTYKVIGEDKVLVDGEEMMTAENETELTIKDGELNGEMSYKPEINIPETEDDYDAAMAAAMLEDLEFSCEIEGTLDESGFDIEMENEISISGMAIKLPVTVKGEISDDKLAVDMDMDISLMGAGIKLGMTALVEKADDVKAGTYDAENAVSLDDEDKLNEFAGEVIDYVSGLEKLAALFSSMGNSSDEGYYDEVYANTLFNIYNDEIDFYFYDDGTGLSSAEYGLEVDEVKGTYTLLEEDGSEVLVITLTGDETADVSGIPFTYEMYEYDDGDVDYYFHSNDIDTEISVYPYSDSAWIDEGFTYSMDDTTITIDGVEMDYTLDEDEGIMILNGTEYNYISYEY